MNFIVIIRLKIGPTLGSKNFEKGVIRLFFVKKEMRRFIFERRRGEKIYKESCGLESIDPKLIRKRGHCKKGKSRLNYMMMLTFNDTILLVCVRTREAMSDSLRIKDTGEGSKFPTPITLNIFYFCVKKTFNILLKNEKNGSSITL